MANEELKQFMIERMLDLDPALSDDEGSLMFVKVIDPLLVRLGTDPLSVDIETFILDRMEDDFPDLDVSSPGSVLRDLLVSPLVLLLEPIRREIEYLRIQHSLEDAEALSEEELDALLTNVFSYRLAGEYARTIQRTFFSAPRTVGIDGSIVFSTGDGIGFVPEENKSYLASDMKRSGTLYYLDVPIRSVQPTAEANVARGAIRFVNGLEGVVRTTNLSTASSGVTAETNETFVERAERSLTERSLNTKRGIETDLLNSFSDLVSVEVVGFGEPDMQRDILTGVANSELVETTGPMVFATNLFRTFPIGLVSSTVELPFTNTVILYGLDADQQSAVLSAQYIRVVDGNSWYDNLNLSRVREIRDVSISTTGSITGSGEDVTVRVKDFTIYPEVPTIGTQSQGTNIVTNTELHGYNRYARGGSAQKLYAEDGGANKILGAPLPMTDWVDASSMTNIPNTAITGRDYLVVTSTQHTYTNLAFDGVTTGPTDDDDEKSSIMRLYPIDSIFSGNHIGVARVDGHMVSRKRIVYPGSASFTYSSDPSVSMLEETISIIDKGGPAITAAWNNLATPGVSDQTRYDGVTTESYNTNPGVALYGSELDGLTSTGTPTGTAKAMWVVLESTQPGWADRGVVPGHHIALAVFDDTSNGNGGASPFDGTTALAAANLSWHAWGRVDRYHPTNANWLLVTGVDWTTLESQQYSLFGDLLAPPPSHGMDGRFRQSWAELATDGSEYTVTSAVDGTEMVVTITPTAGVKSFKPGDGGGATKTDLWTDGGVRVKDTTKNGVWYYDNGAGKFITAGDINNSTSTVDYDTGVVVLRYTAGNHPTSFNPSDFRYSFVTQDQYRAYWTVYEGETEAVDTAGLPYLSFADLAFAPAYRKLDDAGDVAARGPSGFNMVNGGAGPGYYGNHDGSAGAAYDTGAPTDNEVIAHWIRLDKEFHKEHPSLGKTPIEANLAAELYDLADAEAQGSIGPGQNNYITYRYAVNGNEWISTQQVRSGVSHITYKILTSLPTQTGQLALTDPSVNPLTIDYTVNEINSEQQNGFLIPHPMGGIYDDPAYNGESWWNQDWNDHLGFDQQLVQVYQGAVVSTEPAGITLSGMPGGTPFPDFFEGELAVEDNKIHIGGLTDVYVKGSSVTEETTDLTTLSPDRVFPYNSATDYMDIVATGADGSWTSGSSEFTSPTLLSAVQSAFDIGAGTFAHLGNYVVELIDPPSVTPTSFRVLLNSTTGVIIDGTFSTGPFANVKWRLLKSCTTSLENPVTVLQQGTDLATAANDFGVTGVFTFSTDVTLVETFLEIASGPDKGEYRVTQKTAGSLTIDTAMTTTATGVHYRVYTKQGSAVRLPLVRIRRVALSGDDAGVVVPYRHPVDAVATSFTGLNDDPLTDASPSIDLQGTLENFTVSGVETTYFHVVDSAVPANSPDFTALGVITYDVLRIDNQVDPLKYWYVTGVDSYNGGTNNRLKLDRLEGSTTLGGGILENLTFTIGHPSVGRATVYFKDKTHYELGPDAYLSYTEADGTERRFRPSPAESTLVYQSDQKSTVITAGPTNLDELTFGASVNPYAHNIEVGDQVKVVTRVIESNTFTTAAKDLLNVSGQVLMLEIDGKATQVVFSGTNPRTLDDVAADINTAAGAYLDAVVVAAGVDWRMEIRSRTPVKILDEGTSGILSTLGWPSSARDNAPTALVGTYQASAITYDAVAKTTLVKLVDPVDGTTAKPMGGIALTDAIFIQIEKPKYQRLYPSDLLTDASGLHYGTVKLTSYDPFEDDFVEAGQQMASTGHVSGGYEILVDNDNYSYSMGEKLYIRTTPICLGDAASSLATVYALPGAQVTVDYDYSPVTESVQNYLLNPSVRVVNNNPLARHFLPAYPTFSIEYSGTLSADSVLSKIEDYFTTLYPNKELEVYDLTTVLSLQGIGFMKYPQEVAFMYHDENRVVRVIRSTNRLALGKKYHIMEDTSQLSVTKTG